MIYHAAFESSDSTDQWYIESAWELSVQADGLMAKLKRLEVLNDKCAAKMATLFNVGASLSLCPDLSCAVVA